MAKTKIEWAHFSFNPWWGCARVSPGCERCYAEAFAKRTGLAWGVKAERRFFGDKHWNEPLKWAAKAAKAGERHRVFCASMADVFEDNNSVIAERERLWQLIESTCDSLDWLLLTKRPENIRRFASDAMLAECWIGTTVEAQKLAQTRVPILLDVPARVRFLSCEPLLEHVDLTPWLGAKSWAARIHQVIVGGESGGGARHCGVEWIRSLVKQCKATETAVFVKQLGARPFMLDVDEAAAVETFPLLKLRDRKGGDIQEFPSDLQIREFPEVRP